MKTKRLSKLIGLLGAVLLLAVGITSSQASSQQADTQDDIVSQQQALIESQEKLLVERQELIEAQEKQLNEYRCRLQENIQLVSNGCPNTTQSPSTGTTATTLTIPAGTTEAQWEQLRQCNARGNYQYSNPNGVNFGAYQFRQTTWDNLARRNYPQLVGINPSQATSADQNRMAYVLYQEQGWAPWPECAATLPASVPTDGNDLGEANPENDESKDVSDTTTTTPVENENSGSSPSDSDNTEDTTNSSGDTTDSTGDTTTTIITIPSDSNSPTDASGFPTELAVPSGTTQAQWEALIQCESDGNYQAIADNGFYDTYYGAFQFLQTTWNSVAQANYPQLNGVDPRDASPTDQHRMAYALYEDEGWTPWPTCGQRAAAISS